MSTVYWLKWLSGSPQILGRDSPFMWYSLQAHLWEHHSHLEKNKFCGHCNSFLEVVSLLGSDVDLTFSEVEDNSKDNQIGPT